jgi:hypothetical protein
MSYVPPQPVTRIAVYVCHSHMRKIPATCLSHRGMKSVPLCPVPLHANASILPQLRT